MSIIPIHMRIMDIFLVRVMVDRPAREAINPLTFVALHAWKGGGGESSKLETSLHGWLELERNWT
jgi:hypothetical protein